jgi:hypothetical protein
MTDCSQLNGLSRPIDAFVKYFLDVKPYHTKLLEVIEIYRFRDDVNVTFVENRFMDIIIRNKPLCVGSGWGLEWDDECGFDALECCDLFDCTGGYGLIYDNSDLLSSAAITTQVTAEDKIIVPGNLTVDTRVQVLDIVNSTTLTVTGDYSTLFNTHKIFLVVPYKTLAIVSSSDAGTFTVVGNHVADFIGRGEFRVYGSELDDRLYSVTGAEYVILDNRTIVTVAQDDVNTVPSGVGFIELRVGSKNNGAYEVETVTYDGTVTTVTVNNKNNFDYTNETIFGSVMFRTAMIPNRRVWLKETATDELTEFKIVNTYYDSDTNSTEIVFAEKIITDYNEVRLYGYNFGAGFDGNEECSIPKPQNIHVHIGEYLNILINNLVVTPSPTPSVTPTITLTPTPSVTPSITPSVTPSVTPSSVISESSIYVMSGGSLNYAKLASNGEINSLGSNVNGNFYDVITDGVQIYRPFDDKFYYIQTNKNPVATESDVTVGINNMQFWEDGDVNVYEVNSSSVSYINTPVLGGRDRVMENITASPTHVFIGGASAPDSVNGYSIMHVESYEISSSGPSTSLLTVNGNNTIFSPGNLGSNRYTALGRLILSPSDYRIFAFYYIDENNWKISELDGACNEVGSTNQENNTARNIIPTKVISPVDSNERMILVLDSSSDVIQVVWYNIVDDVFRLGVNGNLNREDSESWTPANTNFYNFDGVKPDHIKYDEDTDILHILFTSPFEDATNIYIGTIQVVSELDEFDTEVNNFTITNIHVLSDIGSINYSSLTVKNNIITVMSAPYSEGGFQFPLETTYATLRFTGSEYIDVDNSSDGSGIVRINKLITVIVDAEAPLPTVTPTPTITPTITITPSVTPTVSVTPSAVGPLTGELSTEEITTNSTSFCSSEISVQAGNFDFYVTGGVEPYTYEWEYVSGDPLVIANGGVNQFDLALSKIIPCSTSTSAVWRCKVTDAASTVIYSNNVTANLSHS